MRCAALLVLAAVALYVAHIMYAYYTEYFLLLVLLLVRCCSMLFVVEFTRTSELYGVAAAVTTCIHTVLLRLVFVVVLPLLLRAVVVNTCIINTCINM